MTLFSASICALWMAAFWMLTRDRMNTIGQTLIGIAASLIAVCLASASVQSAILIGYPTDSFWTLDSFGRSGVIAISSIGILAIFLALAWKTRLTLGVKLQISGTAWLVFDIAIGWLIFGIIHTVSPQVFYTFYQFIFASLPNQWVIDTLLDADKLQSIAALSPTGTLADHLAGVALWAIVPFTVWLHLQHWWRG